MCILLPLLYDDEQWPFLQALVPDTSVREAVCKPYWHLHVFHVPPQTVWILLAVVKRFRTPRSRVNRSSQRDVERGLSCPGHLVACS